MSSLEPVSQSTIDLISPHIVSKLKSLDKFEFFVRETIRTEVYNHPLILPMFVRKVLSLWNRNNKRGTGLTHYESKGFSVIKKWHPQGGVSFISCFHSFASLCFFIFWLWRRCLFTRNPHNLWIVWRLATKENKKW